MSKLYDGQELHFPIEFYSPKRFLSYILVILIFTAIIFTYDFFFSISIHRGEVSSFIKLSIVLSCAGCSWLILKQLRQSRPLFTVYKNRIVIIRLFNFKDSEIILWENIKAIHVSHDKYARVSFERLNTELFERQKFIPLQYLELNDIQLNSREVENILRQVFNNAKHNSNQPIIYQKVKLKFWDWY